MYVVKVIGTIRHRDAAGEIPEMGISANTTYLPKRCVMH